jgi:hypothetical protein
MPTVPSVRVVQSKLCPRPLVLSHCFETGHATLVYQCREALQMSDALFLIYAGGVCCMLVV